MKSMPDRVHTVIKAKKDKNNKKLTFIKIITKHYKDFDCFI